MAAHISRPHLLGAWLALACLPNAAHTQSPPPDQIERMNDRLIRARMVRITTPTSVIVVDGVRADADGFAYQDILSSTRGEPLTAPGRVPWNAAVRVDRRGNAALRTAVWSGLVVAAITAAAVASAASQGGAEGPGGGVIAYAIPPVMLLGAGVGALVPAWHAVYRRRHE